MSGHIAETGSAEAALTEYFGRCDEDLTTTLLISLAAVGHGCSPALPDSARHPSPASGPQSHLTGWGSRSSLANLIVSRSMPLGQPSDQLLPYRGMTVRSSARDSSTSLRWVQPRVPRSVVRTRS